MRQLEDVAPGNIVAIRKFASREFSLGKLPITQLTRIESLLTDLAQTIGVEEEVEALAMGQKLPKEEKQQKRVSIRRQRERIA